jgi:O-antigen/teichoic acid export membrane protein
LLAEFLVAAGSHYSVYYGLAIVAGAEQLGRVKAAQTLLGPVVVLLQGGGQLGVPESVRAAHDPALLRRIAARLGLVLAGGSLACGVVTFVALPTVGPVVFPKAWATARPLLPALTAFCIALGVSTGATAALRALGATPWLLRLRAQSGAVLVLLGLAASAALHATGALLSVTVVEGAVAMLAWRRLLRLTTGPTTTLEPDDSRHGDDGRRGRSLLGADEAGADPVRPGGGLPPLDVLEGLGPGPVYGPAAPPA